jgi:AcrR family transcriptional regulator
MATIASKSRDYSSTADVVRFSADENSGLKTIRRRERKTQRTRRFLAEAAIGLFWEKGFAATNVDEIVAAADYSTSTFFRLFRDKEEVVFYDFDDRLEELKAVFSSPHQGGAWSLIRSVFLDFARDWDAAGEIDRQRALLFHREPLLKARYMAKNNQWEEVIATLIDAELQDQPEKALISSLIAGTAVSAFRAAWQYQLTSPGLLKLEDCVQSAFDQLENLDLFFKT